MAESKIRTHGYSCPVRGCDQKRRRFPSPMATAAHIVSKHGEAELAKRLRITTGAAPGGRVKPFPKFNSRRAGETPAPVTLKAPHQIVVYRNGVPSFNRTIDFDGNGLSNLIVEIAGRERFISKSVNVESEEYKTIIKCEGNF